MPKFKGTYYAEPLTRTVTTEPVTLAEIKEQLRFDNPAAAHENDTAITLMGQAAREAAENFCGRYFGINSIVFKAYNYSGDWLELAIYPFTAITQIRISTNNGASFTVVPSTDYHTLKTATGFELFLVNSLTVDEIEITITAGDTPATVKNWIKTEAADLYDTDRSHYTYQTTRSNLKERALGPFIITRYQ